MGIDGAIEDEFGRGARRSIVVVAAAVFDMLAEKAILLCLHCTYWAGGDESMRLMLRNGCRPNKREPGELLGSESRDWRRAE